jgi:hypothetical protein
MSKLAARVSCHGCVKKGMGRDWAEFSRAGRGWRSAKKVLNEMLELSQKC